MPFPSPPLPLPPTNLAQMRFTAIVLLAIVAVAIVGVYLFLNVLVIGSGLTYIATHPIKFQEWYGHVAAGRLEWERYKMPDPLSNETFHVDVAMLSLLYHF